jgi:ribonuclease HI
MQGIRCTGYIDDSLWLHQNPARLRVIQTWVLKLMADLGFIVNIPKSQLEILQKAPYLGMVVDLEAGVMRVPLEKRQAVMTLISQGLSQRRRFHVRDLARIKGKLVAMQWAFGHVAFLYTKAMGKDIAARSSWNVHVKLSQDTVDELHFWLAQFDKFNGTKPLFPPAKVQHVIHMDAAGPSEVSVGGWGAWMEYNSQRITARGHWTADEYASILQNTSSTWMELKAALYALQSFERRVPVHGTVIMLVTDSYNVYSVLQRGRAKADASVIVARAIHAHCFAAGITLLAEWVPREQNAVADALSKCADTSDFTIQAAMCAFEVDLFAGHANHFVPKFYSWHYSPNCAAINAFTQHWGRSCWAHPPYGMMFQVLQHAKDCGARMCLICPYWPIAAWWRLLCNELGTFHNHVHGVHVLGLAGDRGLVDNAGKVLSLRWPLLALLLDYDNSCISPCCVPSTVQP